MNVPVGRFAPSPTGRMHLGNVFAALMSWLSVKSRGGEWVLRIEDLDPHRSRIDYARQLEDDLHWLGLDWDRGGIDGNDSRGPYLQSLRGDFYQAALERLVETGYVYGCICTRADIMATQAPHQSDGRIIYGGTCRPAALPSPYFAPPRPHAMRLFVPDEEINFTDGIFGPQSVNLARECGDFVLRRADGAWAYQLAVVVDDAAMGITEVVRGCDLLLSAAQQIYLYRLLGLQEPVFSHIPLICNQSGQRLSKRDAGIDMGSLRSRFTPGQIIGRLAHAIGLIDKPDDISAYDLSKLYTTTALLCSRSCDEKSNVTTGRLAISSLSV